MLVVGNLPNGLPVEEEQFEQLLRAFLDIQCRYQAGIRQVRTKLEILDEEFRMKHKRNPIHSMQSRMKSVESIIEKLHRRGHDISMASAQENLSDIAGIRVICSYIEDIYTVANLLTRQDDIRVIRVRDYFRDPKPNGYRSLHLIVQVPVFLAQGKVNVPVEVQIRTIAMDFWATLEHSLRYKGIKEIPQELSGQLSKAAEDIAALDEHMQNIAIQVDRLGGESKEDLPTGLGAHLME